MKFLLGERSANHELIEGTIPEANAYRQENALSYGQQKSYQLKKTDIE